MAAKIDRLSDPLLGGIMRSRGISFCGGRDLDIDADPISSELPSEWANPSEISEGAYSWFSVGGSSGQLDEIRLAVFKSVFTIPTESKPPDPDAPWHTRSIPINDLNSDVYQLGGPLQAEIEIYAEEVIARIPELNLWASSSTESEAILKLKKATCELAEELEELEYADLGRQVSMWKRILSKLLSKSVSI